MSAEIPPFDAPGDGPTPENDTQVPELEISGGVSGQERRGALISGDGKQEFGDLEEAPGPEGAEELTQQQQTLILGAWASVCGNCGDNAFPSTETHVVDEGPSCGVRWKYVAVEDMPARAAEILRPDLTYVEPDRSKDGQTADMEAANFSVLEALHDLEDPEL